MFMAHRVTIGDYDGSDLLIKECYTHAKEPEDKAIVLQTRVRSYWLRSNFRDALNDTLLALRLLGVEVNPSPTKREATSLFELVKNEVLAVGFDEVLSIPRTTDFRTELAVALLNDAGQQS